MTQEHDVIRQARTLTTTLATARTQLEELTRNIAALKLPDAPGPLTCPHCGPWHRTATALAEHLYNVDPNRYPVPDHWQQAEARAADVSTLAETP